MINISQKSGSCSQKYGTCFAYSRSCADKSATYEENFTQCPPGQAKRIDRAEKAASGFENALFARVYIRTAARTSPPPPVECSFRARVYTVFISRKKYSPLHMAFVSF